MAIRGPIVRPEYTRPVAYVINPHPALLPRTEIPRFSLADCPRTPHPAPRILYLPLTRRRIHNLPPIYLSIVE